MLKTAQSVARGAFGPLYYGEMGIERLFKSMNLKGLLWFAM